MRGLVLFFALSGFAGAIIAARKGRNPLVWFLLCAIAPLVIAVIILLPPLPNAGYTRKCPFCSEIIKEDAKLCKHCGREQPVEMVRVNSRK